MPGTRLLTAGFVSTCYVLSPLRCFEPYTVRLSENVPSATSITSRLAAKAAREHRVDVDCVRPGE